MGVSYSVTPLGSNDEDFRDWLREYHNKEYPQYEARGRYPTPLEVREVLDKLEGYKVEYAIGSDFWDGEVAHLDRPEYASVIVLGFKGNEHEELHFYFERGWKPLNLLILRELSRRCGPLALISDDESEPVIVAWDETVT